MIERIGTTAKWNLSYDFTDVKSNKPIFIPNLNRTVTVFNVVTDDKFPIYESEQLMFHMKLEKIEREYQVNRPGYAENQCRICSKIAQCYGSEIPPQYKFWNSYRDGYDNGRLLNICKKCYEYSQEWILTDNIISKPLSASRYLGHNARFISDPDVVHDIVAIVRKSKEDMIYLVRSIIPLQPLSIRLIFECHSCYICGRHLRWDNMPNICVNCTTNNEMLLKRLERLWMLAIQLPLINDLRKFIYDKIVLAEHIVC